MSYEVWPAVQELIFVARITCAQAQWQELPKLEEVERQAVPAEAKCSIVYLEDSADAQLPETVV